jgi:DNA-binding Xre family transcriptional regulator
MKANVLLATQDRQLGHRLLDEVADLCSVQVSASPGHAFTQLRERPFRVFIVDATLPHLDSLELAHALQHSFAPDGVFVSWGPLGNAVYVLEAKRWEPVVVRRSFGQLVETLRARLDPAAARSVAQVRYQPAEETFLVAFRNGKTYELSRKVIEADDGTPIGGEPRVIHRGEAFRVRQKSGNTYEVAWDFVLYHQEPAYPYHKGRAEQQRAESDRAHRIAARIRQERKARGWSLADLAQRTGIHPPNLSRLESGKHDPSLETLERVAEGLGVRLADLLAH